MSDLSKVFMYKDYRPSHEIFTVLKELKNYYIVKKMDTLDNSVNEILPLEKNFAKNHMYTAQEFLNEADYIGKTGYYKDMPDFLKYAYDTFVLVYRDDYNELLYDTISNFFFITAALAPKEDFVVSDVQYPKIKFKKGLGKK